jgi:two-component system, sensor histidine kinase and response regulator
MRPEDGGIASIFDSVRDAIPVVTYVQEVTYPNVTTHVGRQVTTLLGYEPKECTSDPEHWIKILHPDDKERVLDEARRTNETGEPFRMEYRQFAKDGSVVWVRDEATLVHDEEGNPSYWLGVKIDVTERKQAEEALHKSEARFRALIRNSSDVIATLDAEGRIVFESDSVERVMGSKPEALIGTDPFHRVHPDDLPRAQSLFAELLSIPGATRSAQVRARHRDGSWRLLEVIGTNLLHDPSVASIVANYRDITESKRTEHAVHEARDRFRSVFDHAPIGMAVVSIEGRYLQVNRPLCEVLGYSEDELLATKWPEITHPDDLEASWAYVRRIVEGEIPSYHLEKRFLHADGRTVWASLSVSLVRDSEGEPLYFVSKIQDVTERKEAERKLREAEQRYRTLVEQIPAVTYIDRADGSDEPLYTSPQIEAMLGYTPQEWIEGRLWPEQLHPDDRERILAADERFETGGEPFSQEYRLFAKNGSVVWVREEAVVLRNEAGKPLFWQGVIFDITERKEAEEETKEANRRLEELAVLRADFTAMVAHELDTPLAVIRGYAEMLAAGALEPAEQSRALNKILAETELLNTLVDDVRAAATAEQDGLTVQPQPISVRALLDTAAQCGAPLLGNHRIVIENTADDEQVWADANRINQVLRNLISNAVKYSPDSAPIELRVRPGKTPGRVRVEVADRGAGIHPADVTRVFEKFGRGRDRYGRKVAGVGLGLYLSRRIIWAHGSDLTLDLPPDGGSVFSFELGAVR